MKTLMKVLKTKTMNKDIWKKGWFFEILNQAEKEVQSWPAWMQQPEMRFPLNRHVIISKKIQSEINQISNLEKEPIEFVKNKG